MKKLLCVSTILIICLCSCHTDKRIRVKPAFEVDRTSPEYQEVLYKLWRLRELKRFEDWYERKYRKQK